MGWEDGMGTRETVGASPQGEAGGRMLSALNCGEKDPLIRLEQIPDKI